MQEDKTAPILITQISGRKREDIQLRMINVM